MTKLVYEMTNDLDFTPSCPIPGDDDDRVQLAHGGGGRAMARLLDTVIRPAFDDPALARQHDGAEVALDGLCALSTDSYVVRPLFFPGGDIGSLAVCGAVNDVAMCGARARFLSVGFILEEGLPMDTLRRVVASMRAAAQASDVRIVTGDLKVVDHGSADGMFINTTAIGPRLSPAPIEPQRLRPGDAVILSGDIGRHGIAVMAARDGLGFEPAIESDCAPLVDPAMALIEAGIAVRCLRDLTRGGLASGVVEIAETAGLAVTLDEKAIAVRGDVGAACEILGLDPIHVANEGRFVAFVAPADAARAVAILRRHPVAANAAVIGEVGDAPAGRVSIRGALGGTRIVDMPSGEQLPRIC